MATDVAAGPVLEARDQGVLTLTLNRPERLNAITDEVLDALAADLRIAAESATFVQAFVRIGLIPDAGSTYFLPRLVGPARAAEMMMLGDPADAARALEMGLVSAVVADADLPARAHAMASR